MTGVLEGMDIILTYVVEISTVLMEMAGICVLVSTAVKCFYGWLKKTDRNIRLDLGEGIALALEFKMGGWSSRWAVRCCVRSWSGSGGNSGSWEPSSCCAAP